MCFKKLLSNSLVLAIVLLLQVTVVQTSNGAETTDTGAVDKILAGLSDEQARQMLIKELQKDLEQERSVTLGSEEVQGPGAPLAKLLNSLDSESAESGDRFKELWMGLPNLFPDIYKVFITL